MADPKRRLIAVDENYVAPANPTPGEQLQADLAAQKREGIKIGAARQKARQDTETALQIQGVKNAHLDELNRSGRIVAKAAHRDGVLQGMIIGMAAAIATGLATWTVLREVVITNVSTQRVPMAGDGVPELTVPESQLRYERNPREPADAQ